MSTTFITPSTLAQAEWHLEASGVTDMVCPPRPPGRRGRIGMIRNNTYLLLLGWVLCTMLGLETTLQKVHDVLTTNLTREDQWRLGVLRKAVTTRPSRDEPETPDWYTKKLNKRGKRQKITWNGFEQIGYDDLVNAVRHFRDLFDYGIGTAPDLDPDERARRAKAVAAMKSALIAPTLIARPDNGTAVALDATGQWAWSRGPDKVKHELEKEAEHQRKAQTETEANNEDKDLEPPLEIGDIATDDDDSDITAPAEPPPTPTELKRRCPDAAWGYRTEKDGRKGPGFGFHQHTLARVPHPDALSDAEPHLIEDVEITPANADVVDATLLMIDRVLAARPFKIVICDLLYTNLKANRWAVPLADRGIEQCLAMSSKDHKVTSVRGALMQHHWLHCPAAPMADRPAVPDRASEHEWEEVHVKIEKFHNDWAFTRKESGLLGPTSKWICPMRDGRTGCTCNPASLEMARTSGLPIITAPADWESRDCCKLATIEIRPDPTKPAWQRKLAQRYYYGSRKWRRLFKRRSMVEGVFGILKNPSKQRMRRGHNRVAGIAIASLLTGIKAAVYNAEQVRSWHAKTRLGPADHPLLQPNPTYHGHTYLDAEHGAEIDRKYMTQQEGDQDDQPTAA